MARRGSLHIDKDAEKYARHITKDLFKSLRAYTQSDALEDWILQCCATSYLAGKNEGVRLMAKEFKKFRNRVR